MSTPEVPIAPADICVRFAHAVVEHLAVDCGADVLHIKGAAIEPGPALPGRTGSDADVLVRPAHVPRLLAAFADAGWMVETDFEHGSPFGHATTLLHPVWGYADVHRYFPGITLPAEDAFDLLWDRRSDREIAGIPCPVPDPLAHAVILVLNAARPGVNAATDLEMIWFGVDDQRRREMRELADRLGAEVALAAAIGELDRYQDRRDYDLWRVTTEGGSRIAEWKARIKAAPTRKEALRLALIAPAVNTEHLAVSLGRRPTRTEVAREFVSRVRRGLDELWQLVRNRRGGGRRR